MATLDDLSPDQRAVLQLLLRQDKSYVELATLLRITPEAVRGRAVAALEALGADAGEGVPSGRRSELTDWLLGQQDSAEASATESYLAASPAALVWAAAVADELREIGGDRIPEVPSATPTPVSELPPPAATPPEDVPVPPSEAPPLPAITPPAPDAAADEEVRLPGFAPAGTGGDALGAKPRSSKLGGALLLAGLAVVVAVVLVILLTGGDSGTAGSTSTTAASTATTSTTSTTSTTPTVEAQVNLQPPGGGKALGVANVLRQGTQRAISLQAQNLTPNTKANSYAVWLTGGPNGAVKRIGFAPAVGKDGRLAGAALLPDNVGDYTRIEISLESEAEPAKPTKVVLRGAL